MTRYYLGFFEWFLLQTTVLHNKIMLLCAVIKFVTNAWVQIGLQTCQLSGLCYKTRKY